MKVLIVEDNKSERDLLRSMLEANYQHFTKFREASDLKSALGYLEQGDVDCVLLDLHLPDSFGTETFAKISYQYPEVPVLVMTNTKDRNLAVELVRMGAADYIVKGSEDDEGVFQRILLSIERHKYSIRVSPGDAASVYKVEKSTAQLKLAHQDGDALKVHESTVETTVATADLARRIFTEVQRLNLSLGSQSKALENVTEVAEGLRLEVLEGVPDQPSLKAKVDRLATEVGELRGKAPSKPEGQT